MSIFSQNHSKNRIVFSGILMVETDRFILVIFVKFAYTDPFIESYEVIRGMEPSRLRKWRNLGPSRAPTASAGQPQTSSPPTIDPCVINCTPWTRGWPRAIAAEPRRHKDTKKGRRELRNDGELQSVPLRFSSCLCVFVINQ